MPTWGALLKELERLRQSIPDGADPSALDVLRRTYLKRLSEHTQRATIVYATAWMENRPEVPAQAVQLVAGDMHGFMEVCSNITERELDLIISTPGGSPEAAESIMGYLRTRFDHIRAIVPVSAMSAGTMMALACDEIVLASHSQLGPIDPQFTIFTPEGPRSAPGQAIIDQFELAKAECQDPANIAAWLPMLRGLMPGLLAQCQAARQLSEEFAKTALEAHMFAGDADAATKATAAAAWFADFSTFKSHGRRVSRDDARAQGLNVTDLENDPDLQDLVLSVYHATRLTFAHAGAVKVFENHNGRAYIEAMQMQVVGPIPQPPPQRIPIAAPGQPPIGAFGQPVAGNREQRRAQNKKGNR